MGFYVLLLDFYDLSSAASSGVADHVISACIARRFAGRRGWMHHAGITESIFEKYAQVDAQQNQISCHLTIDLYHGRQLRNSVRINMQSDQTAQ
jgi:hypothetical protein